MSAHESKHSSPQSRPQSGKPDNSSPPKAPPRPGGRKPLPFDDDETGTSGHVVESTNPKIDFTGGSI